jgi:radical SAM protein with 4Fe4S-binding SPASM domain
MNMIQIKIPNVKYMNVLGNAKQGNGKYRLSQYCVSRMTEDGVLLHHTLTREVILLTHEEFENALESDYLRKNWFVVPLELDEQQIAKGVVWFNRATSKKSDIKTTYTILSTTDCNARCFYCFEMGRAHINMSDEVALKTAQYIRDNCGGKEVLLRWFGGEPLYNSKAIDLICQRLNDYGVTYRSNMVSNGYLFDDEMVSKAVGLWNLKRVQISLDGTEQIYNRCKAYIYKEGSAYQIVMDNIQRLLDSNVKVLIRMNLDFHNVSDLKLLCEEIGRRFGKRKNLYVYPYLIFDSSVSWEERYSVEQWEQLYSEKEKLNQQLIDLGLYAFRSQRIKDILPVNHCIADSDHAVVILPTGQLCTCENYSEDEVIGHIDDRTLNKKILDSWRITEDEITECKTCFYYPECIRLKKCTDEVQCNLFERNALMRNTQRAMRNEYRIWKKEHSGDNHE